MNRFARSTGDRSVRAARRPTGRRPQRRPETNDLRGIFVTADWGADLFASADWGPDLFTSLEWWRPAARQRSRRRWVIAAALVAIVAVGYLLAGRRDTPIAPFDITGLDPSLEIGLVEPPTLGRAAVVKVTGLFSSDQPLTRLSVLHTSGTGAYRTEHWVVVADGTAEIPIATQPMREAGQHSLVFFTDRQRGQLEIWLDAAAPRPGFVPVVGPTRVTADTAQLVVVTVNSTDRLGNGLADDTEVQLVVRRPDGVVDEYFGTVKRLLAGIEVPVTNAVGTVSVVATIGGVPSEPVEFEQVAGPPSSLELAADERRIVADGRSIVAVRATNVADSNGNQVVDGTVLEAEVTSASGAGHVDAEVINGEAVFLLRAPTVPGPIVFVMRADETATVAEAITIIGSPAVEDFPANWDATRGSVTVGPVTAPNGGFVADGATVELLLDTGVVTSGQVLDGHATLIPPASASINSDTEIEVRILGVTRPVTR